MKQKSMPSKRNGGSGDPEKSTLVVVFLSYEVISMYPPIFVILWISVAKVSASTFLVLDVFPEIR